MRNTYISAHVLCSDRPYTLQGIAMNPFGGRQPELKNGEFTALHHTTHMYCNTVHLLTDEFANQCTDMNKRREYLNIQLVPHSRYCIRK
jgi:hypothetical protein